MVAVGVGVSVAVGVAVNVAVAVGVLVAVGVNVAVEVAVAVGVDEMTISLIACVTWHPERANTANVVNKSVGNALLFIY